MGTVTDRAEAQDGQYAHLGPAGLSVDALVDATPAHRDRVVDLLRVVSIGVVVLWHWTFSITHWRGGSLRMPNPIGDVPGLWSATWLLQVMPLFFLVGGYANLATWTALRRDADAPPGRGRPDQADQAVDDGRGPNAGTSRSGDRRPGLGPGGNGRRGLSELGHRRGHAAWWLARQFWAKRFGRLIRPVAVYVACWGAGDLAWQAGGGRSVLGWGLVVFVPLWFLGVYVAVVALVPVTARWHATHPVATLVALAGGILAADLARLGAGVGAAGLAGSALVWVFCHQLGYVWRDWPAAGPDAAPPAHVVRRRGARGRRAPVLLVAGGLATLVGLTQLGPYPVSMVAVRGEATSNMFPTTACIAALAVVQLGLVLTVRGGLARWLQRRSVWRSVVAANGVAMTVFCWHMTALVGFLLTYQVAGFTLTDEPTAAWWLTRPVWIVGPAVLLAALVAGFARFETGRRTHTTAS